MMGAKGTDVEIVRWDPRYRDDFARLNEAWVTTFFEMEEIDRRYLFSPEESIIAPGGEIVFLLDAGRVVGTCALVPHAPGVFELAKMAVDERDRGRGLGNVLMQAVIDCARDIGAGRIFLLSNTRLTPAISLYKKFGFETVRLGPHPDYERADIEMSLDLDPAAPSAPG